MALAIDASSPARFNLAHGTPNDDPTGTSATFNPPAGSLLVLSVACDTAAGNSPSITYSGGGLTYAERVYRGDAEGTAGVISLCTAPVPVGGSQTVTIVVNNMGVSRNSDVAGSCKVWVVTGQDASPIGASAENSSTTDDWTPAGPTTGAANSLVFGTGGDWNAAGAPTSSDLTEDAFTNSYYSGLHGYKLVASAGDTTINFNAAGAPDWNMVSLEIKEASGAAPDRIVDRSIEVRKRFHPAYAQ
jgi:hypothetical protein